MTRSPSEIFVPFFFFCETEPFFLLLNSQSPFCSCTKVVLFHSEILCFELCKNSVAESSAYSPISRKTSLKTNLEVPVCLRH